MTRVGVQPSLNKNVPFPKTTIESPLVSVVIPTYNYGHLVGEAVESALAQTYPSVEVIVIDDGSLDDTRERLTRYGNRIRYCYQPNAGLSAARNAGIQFARGDFIAFLDSDDAFHPTKLEVQMRWMQGDPSIALCATDCIGGDTPKWPTIDPGEIHARDVTLMELVLRSRFGSCGVLVRKQCFERVGNFDTSLRSAEDRDMWIRIASEFRVVKLSAPLWWYRPTPGSMSRNAAKMELFERMVLERALAAPTLQSRWWFRQKVLGLASLAAARRYQGCKSFGAALQRLTHSIVSWPFPYLGCEGVVPLGRLRLLFAILRQAATEKVACR